MRFGVTGSSASVRDARYQVLFVIGLVGLGIVLFAAAMTADMNYDEEQYVSGAYFARSLSIYRDFISFQPPVYTWIVSMALHVASPWYLLAARVVTGILSVGTSLLLVSLLLSVGTGRLAAFALVLAFVASPFMEIPLATARNDIMPLFFLLLGLRFFFGRRWEIARGAGRQLGAGFFLVLAACTKYTYAFAAPVLALAVLWDSYGARKQNERLLSVVPVLWFLVGAAAGALPVLYELLVNFRNFVFSTVVFHTTAGLIWYRDQGLGYLLSHRSKLYGIVQVFTSGGNATLLIVAAGGALCPLLSRDPGMFRNRRRPFGPLIVLAALFAVGCILAYVPTLSRTIYLAPVAALGALCVGMLYWAVRPPIPRPLATLLATLFGAGVILAYLPYVPTSAHTMYFAPVAAVGTLCVGMLYSTVRPAIPRLLAAGLLALALLPTVSAFARYGELLARSTNVREWTGVKVHRSAMAIADLITKGGASGHVATLFPMTVLDANAVRPEFASGPFFFRSADAFSAEQIAQLHGVGPKTLDTLFAVSPPAAIVGGFQFKKWNSRMDEPLIEYAKRNGYRKVAEGVGIQAYPEGEVWGGEVWVRVPQSRDIGQ